MAGSLHYGVLGHRELPSKRFADSRRPGHIPHVLHHLFYPSYVPNALSHTCEKPLVYTSAEGLLISPAESTHPGASQRASVTPALLSWDPRRPRFLQVPVGCSEQSLERGVSCVHKVGGSRLPGETLQDVGRVGTCAEYFKVSVSQVNCSNGVPALRAGLLAGGGGPALSHTHTSAVHDPRWALAVWVPHTFSAPSEEKVSFSVGDRSIWSPGFRRSCETTLSTQKWLSHV